MKVVTSKERKGKQFENNTSPALVWVWKRRPRPKAVCFQSCDGVVYIPARLLAQPRGFRYTIRVTDPSLLSQQEHRAAPQLLSHSPNTHNRHTACQTCQSLTCGHKLLLHSSCWRLLALTPSSAVRGNTPDITVISRLTTNCLHRKKCFKNSFPSLVNR